MNQSIFLTSTLCGIASVTTLLASPAEAQIKIEDTIAQQEATPIKIVPGKTSTIHFKDESISYIKLSDPSKTVYSVNAPIDSGFAKTIFLNQTEQLKFPGQTTHERPNLYIVAIDKEGNQKNYEFVIDNSPQNETKISIVSPSPAETKPVNAINTELGLANPYDVLEGLKYKLRTEEITSNSPLVVYVSEVVSTTLNSEKTLLEVAEELQVPLSVLTEFGRVGLIEKAKAQKLQVERIQASNEPRIAVPHQSAFPEERRSLQGSVNTERVSDEHKSETHVVQLPSATSEFSSSNVNKITPPPPIEIKNFSSSALSITNNNLKRQITDKDKSVSPLVRESPGEFNPPHTSIARTKVAFQNYSPKNPNSLELVNSRVIETDLGSATFEDVKFGLSVLRKKNQISEQKARSLEKAIQGDLKANDPKIMAELRDIARTGLAFKTRLRLLGTIS